MPRLLYIWKSEYPWDVRIEKVCSALGRAGFDVWLLSKWADGLHEFEDTGDFKIFRVGKGLSDYMMIPVSVNPVWRKIIKEKIDELKPDMVMPREIMLAEASADIAHKFDIPVVIDMAEHYPAAMKGWKKYSDSFLKRLFVHQLDIPDLVEKRSVAKADGVITVCDEQNIRLNRDFNYSFDNVLAVHNTPDLEWFDGTRKGTELPPKVFAYHGYISYDRNLDVMINAFILAARSKPQLHFTISGAIGEGYDDLKSIAVNSDAHDRIQFTGPYKHSDINQLYSQMDIGVLPYKNNEFINHTLSNKLFDYMAVGKPIIVSKAVPMVRIVNETKCGVVCDCSSAENLAEAILDIESQPLADMSVNGINAAVNKYNWAVDSGNMVEFLKKYL